MAQPAPGMFNNRFTQDAGSVGILWAGLEARVVRDDGTDAALNEPGELYLRGPNVTPGYWANEKANRDTFVNGWLRTGDMFSVDKEGKFYFVDRIKVSNLRFRELIHLMQKT
jgi:long-subunit acyl-CoA synthetase (AMP-forming)